MHGPETATVIANTDILPKVLYHLGHENIFVQKQTARLIKEIAQHSLDVITC